ncbi:MAG: hypothetical protein ACREN8_02335 [Candidatus Dormibacteraceae bacterium]
MILSQAFNSSPPFYLYPREEGVWGRIHAYIGPWILDKLKERRERKAAQRGNLPDGRPSGPPGSPPPRQSSRPPKAKPPTPEELGKKLEQLRGLSFCVLFDLCCWLASARQEVPENTQEYTLTHLRPIPDPRQRLQYYVNPQLLALWEQALQPFFATGLRLSPELGDSAMLREEGLDRGGPVRVELRFNNRSSLLSRGRPRQPLPRGELVLTMWVSADLARIDDATLRPLVE